MKLFKFPVVFILMIAVVCSWGIHTWASEAPYYSYTVDKDGSLVATKDGYLPSRVLDKFDEEVLNKPSDLFIDDKGLLYIADTENKRILICDKEGNVKSSITEGLVGPTGLYVTDKSIYVADPKAKKVFMYSLDGELLYEYDKPTSPLFGKNSKYAPKKVVVDSAGSLYIISEGNTNGIINVSKDNDFFGYFGANETGISLSEMLKRITFTQEQKEQLQKNVPPSANNITMDERGIVYTVTQGKKGGIKKYNVAGKNMLVNEMYCDEYINDIATGRIENIFTVSSAGYIYEYTREGDLFFLFGGEDDGKNRTGLFVSAVAIDVDEDGKLYVLDSETGNITVFEKTEYASTIHNALNLFQEGKYIDSRVPWEEVLRQNTLFDYVHYGLGNSYLKLEMYDQALESFEKGGGYEGYSDSFWEIRNKWLRDNLVICITILIILYVIFKIAKIVDRKTTVFASVHICHKKVKSNLFVKEISFIKYIIKNPVDAFYGIKKEHKVSVISATVYYFIFFFIYLFNKYFSGFLFRTAKPEEFNLLVDSILCLGIMALVVICINLIGSIRSGEGSLKDIYCSFIYCFAPYFFLKPLVILLSYILTANESFIISLLNFILVSGCGILLFMMIKEIQAYSVSETIRCILLTIFTMTMLVIGGVIMMALVGQVGDFAISLWKEALFRVR